MYNTKTIVLAIVSLLLIIGIIGATVGVLAVSLKEADQMLDDAMGQLMGEDTASPEGTEADSELAEPSEPADPWADGKLTYADGEVSVGYRQNTAAGFSGYSVYSKDLKPDTTYTIHWSLKSTYESYGFYIEYYDINGVSTPIIRFSRSSVFTGLEIIYPTGTVSVSPLLRHSFNITTDSNGYIELMFFRSDDTSDEACNENKEIFKSLIVYFEIEEVSA